MSSANNENNVWRTIALVLLGVVIGYVIGRFELTTITLEKDVEPSKASKTETQQEDDKSKKTTKKEPVTPAIQDISIDDDPFLGDENAPIVIVDFSDYECPFCKRLFTNIYPALKEEFIDTGKVKYVFRDFPLNIHAAAPGAHMAAECADDQGKYWEMHDLLFEKQSEWGKAEELNDTLTDYAVELGMNKATFSECLTSEKYKDEIESDKAAGIEYGVKGTPTLFINGMPLRGLPQSYSQFKQLLENEL